MAERRTAPESKNVAGPRQRERKQRVRALMGVVLNGEDREKDYQCELGFAEAFYLRDAGRVEFV